MGSTTNCLQFVLLSIQSSIVHNAGYDVVSSRAAHHGGPHNCSRTIFSWTGRSSGCCLTDGTRARVCIGGVPCRGDRGARGGGGVSALLPWICVEGSPGVGSDSRAFVRGGVDDFGVYAVPGVRAGDQDAFERCGEREEQPWHEEEGLVRERV